jgi:hypothetical protein
MTNQPHIAAHTAATQANAQTKAEVRAAIPTHKKILIALILVITTTAFNTISIKKVINSTDINSISFGSGGGFTGAVTKYQINSKGEVVEIKTLEKTSHQLKKINKNELKTINKKINKLSGEQLKFNHPGNLYYFIEFEKDKKKINITWGDPAFNEPKEVKELYEYLNTLIKP